jgi:hypothetical protein
MDTNHTNHTGIEYPTIELGGKTYIVKFSRGILYRLGKAGVDIRTTRGLGDTINMPFTQLVDAYHVVIAFEGTHEELAELLFDKKGDALTKLILAVGKTLPAAPIKLQEPAASEQIPPDRTM